MFYPKADTELDDDVLRRLADLGPQISPTAAGIAFAATGRRVVSVVPSETSGTFHEIFLARDDTGAEWVVKANRLFERFRDHSPSSEQYVSDLLSRHGVPHGTVIYADCSRTRVDFEFDVMEQVVGRSFRSFDDDDGLVALNQPAVAAYLRRCHAIRGEFYGLVIEGTGPSGGKPPATWAQYLVSSLSQHLDILTTAGLISDQDAATISDVISREASLIPVEVPRLLHGDCGPHNIVLGESGDIAMIDWEDALFGDPLFDVALWSSFNPVRRWQGFFDAYFDGPWTPSFTFWLYFLRISLAKAVVRLRFGYQDLPAREPSAGRIHRALAAMGLSAE